jgi:hypothetical protein
VSLTLPELMSQYQTVMQTVTSDPARSVVLAPADSMRWGLVIVASSPLSLVSQFRPTSISSVGFDSTYWYQRVELNNRDHPGLPQQEWVAGPSMTTQTWTVIMISKITG